MTAIIIALNAIFAVVVVGVIVGLHARAILASHEENVAAPRQARPRTRPATARPVRAGRLAHING